MKSFIISRTARFLSYREELDFVQTLHQKQQRSISLYITQNIFPHNKNRSSFIPLIQIASHIVQQSLTCNIKKYFIQIILQVECLF